jgi:hypothetical protein
LEVRLLSLILFEQALYSILLLFGACAHCLSFTFLLYRSCQTSFPCFVINNLLSSSSLNFPEKDENDRCLTSYPGSCLLFPQKYIERTPPLKLQYINNPKVELLDSLVLWGLLFGYGITLDRLEAVNPAATLERERGSLHVILHAVSTSEGCIDRGIRAVKEWAVVNYFLVHCQGLLPILTSILIELNSSQYLPKALLC